MSTAPKVGRIVLATWLGALVLAAGCGCSAKDRVSESDDGPAEAAPTAHPPPAEIALDAGDDGGRVDMERGQLLVVTLEGNLDYHVQLTLMREHNLVAKLLRVLTYPVSKLFEFRVRGPIEDPKWYPTNFSGDLLIKLGAGNGDNDWSEDETGE